MSPIACDRVEELLAAASPEQASRVLRHGTPPDLAAHLSSCASCLELARGIASLAALAEIAPPSARVVAAALQGAAAEARSGALGRRRASRVAGLKAVLAFVAALPVIVSAHLLAASLFIRFLAPHLPEPARVYAAVLLAGLALAGLSAVVFVLTLLAGAAGRPPRPPVPLEA